MKWKKYTLKTTTAAVDIVSAMLDEIGIEGIEVEDGVPLSEEDKQRMFVDIVPDGLYDDGNALIHFYLKEGLAIEDEQSIMKQIEEGLLEASEYVDIGEGSINSQITDEDEWMDNWKQFFKPFKIGDSIIIKPVWEDYEDIKEGDIMIELNPGRAFGTGSHETTKLCIMAMQKYMRAGSNVLDIGSGSGILSIAAKKLGADKVLGTDIDVIAVDASKENAGINNYSEDEVSFFELDVIGNEEHRKQVLDKMPEGYDLVAANMLADVIIPLAERAGQFMKKGACFISSGIIDMKAGEVKESLLKNGFSILETLTLGEWVSYIAILE